MIFDDPRRRKKNLPAGTKLEILGCSAYELVRFLRIIGVDFGTYYAEKKPKNQPPEGLLDELEYGDFLPWMVEAIRRLARPKKAKVLSTEDAAQAGLDWAGGVDPTSLLPYAVLDHLIRRKLILATLRYWQARDGLRYRQDLEPVVPAVIFDVDAHNEQERRTLDRRLEIIKTAFPFPVLEFTTQRHESRQLVFPLDVAAFYQVPPLDDPVIASPGELWRLPLPSPMGPPSDDDPIMVRQRAGFEDMPEIVRKFLNPHPKQGFLGHSGLNAIPLIADGLERVMGEWFHGVEVFPKLRSPLRLPLGHGSVLVLPDGDFIEHPGDAITWALEYYDGNRGQLPTINEFTLQLDKATPVTEPCKTSWKKKGDGEAAGEPNTMMADTSMTPDELLENGLPGPDTRNDAGLVMIRYFDFTVEPRTPEALADLVWEWFEGAHNGFSDLMNESPTKAREWVGQAVQNWVGKRRAPRDRTKGLVTEEEALEALKRYVGPLVSNEANAVAAHHSLALFVIDLVAYGKQQLLRAGRLGPGDAHVVDLPVVAVKAMKGCSKKSGRPTYYKGRLDWAKSVGLLTDHNEAYHTGQSRAYKLHFRFSAGGRPLARELFGDFVSANSGRLAV